MGLAQLKSSRRIAPRKTLLYGTHGIGKSTWASRWPNCCFIDCEDGIAELDVPTWGVAASLKEAWQPLMDLVLEEHDYQTVVIDTVDWLEKLLYARICEIHGKKHIGEFKFQEGYTEASKKFYDYLLACNEVYKKGMHVIFLAHCDIVKYSPPGEETYDRFSPKLHKSIAGMLQEWATEVLFARYRTYTRETDEGFGRRRAIATGIGERVLLTTERPGHQAKNRLGLPEEMSFEFEEYLPFLTRNKE